ncbi:MAG: NADP-dependent isocitrate dehydrogenase [Oscillospiraceae bacterium]|nr:NADP-dependent isocitrate dehydrogenase [Oscillospiraceae bacterium]
MITMKNPIVEMDGDEMTRVIWQKIKDELLRPYLELQTEYYDLGLPNREATGDRVTADAAEAVKRLGVGVKCATITPNADRVKEYGLTQMWKSPNGTIRAILDGTVFRAPILTPAIRPYIPTWRKPITIARHAFGDIYRATEYRVEEAGKAELVFTGADGKERSRQIIYDFPGKGVLQGQFNRDDSIRSFAHACFRYALSVGQDLWFSAKDTISKQYDGQFKRIFEELYEQEYRAAFEKAGLRYRYLLIDSAAAGIIRSEGGFIWACKNYDGDVMSDLVSAAFGSIAMMTSVLVSPDGMFEYEAAHGTVQDQYYRHLRGERTSVNPIATIYAWTGALRKRGELDGTPALGAFADRLEKACLQTVEDGVMTDDLAALQDGVSGVDTDTFLAAIRERIG